MGPSKVYYEALEAAKEHHRSSKTYSGSFLRPHGVFIKEIVDRLGCRSILDYGAGKGVQYSWVNPKNGLTLEQWWGVPVTKYDPAYEPFSAEPEGKFDLVICTHTLGAVPSVDVPWLVDRLYGFANKAIYVAEKLDPVRKKIHSSPEIYPREWSADRWKSVLSRASDIEVTLSTREIKPEGRIMTHYRMWRDGKWSVVRWGDSIPPHQSFQ